MTANLAHARCALHELREAAARCPVCRRFFCRECITEHEGRVICAACLRATVVAAGERRTFLREPLRLAAALGGIIVVWLFFLGVGRILLDIPSSFHEGTVWREAMPWL